MFQFLPPRAFMVQLINLNFCEYEIPLIVCKIIRKNMLKLFAKYFSTIANCAVNMFNTEEINIGKNMNTLVF